MFYQCNATLGPALQPQPERERGETGAQDDVKRSEMCGEPERHHGPQTEMVIGCARDADRARLAKRSGKRCNSGLDEDAEPGMECEAPCERERNIKCIGV